MEELLRGQANVYADLISKIKFEMWPQGVLNMTVGKPYAAIFLHRPLGYHPVSTLDRGDLDTERRNAHTATTTLTLVDASALHTLVLIPAVAPKLVSYLSKPAITDVALRDVLASENHFHMPFDATMTYDSDLGRVIAVEDDPRIRSMWRERSTAMLDQARKLRKLAHKELKHFPQLDQDRPLAWVWNTDAAKEHDGRVIALSDRCWSRR
jgi:hypothetical protein